MPNPPTPPGRPDALTEMLTTLAQKKQHYRDLDQQAKEARRDHERYQAQVYDHMREQGLLSIKTHKGTYSAKSTVYAKVQDLDAFIEWATANGLSEEFLREKEVGARLNEFVRDAVANGSPLPNGVVWYPKEYISLVQEA